MPDRTVEELREELEIEIEPVAVDLIDPIPDNPNEVDEAKMAALSREIDRGFVQPIVVRPGKDGRWNLVDGEHRWLLVKEKGHASIPAVIDRNYEDGQAGDDEARIRSLTLNELRGQAVPIKMAYVLADLAKRIPEKELRTRLGMDEAQLRDHLRLATFTDDLGDRLREHRDREDREAPKVLAFTCSQRDAALIERVVEAVAGDTLDSGKALAKICREHEKAAKA